MFTIKPVAETCEEMDEKYTDGQNLDEPSALFGVSAVLRMTFALFIFHVFIILLILPRVECSSVIHDGGWCFKFLLISALFIAFFWIPIEFFQGWAEVCRYTSLIFLVIQVFYILDGAYSFNEYMVG